MSPHSSNLRPITFNFDTPPPFKFIKVHNKLLLPLVLSLLTLFILVSPHCAGALTQDADGVYLIATSADLIVFRDGVNLGASGDARLTADIDLSLPDGTPTEWTPIGNRLRYVGVFDGAGHTVSGYTITEPATATSSIGFFGAIGYATIRGLTVSGDIDVQASKTCYAGGIVGQVHDDGTVEDCVNRGTVRVNAAKNTSIIYVGGITGLNSGAISNCVNYSGASNLSSQATNPQHAGGIAGMSRRVILNCANYGEVQGEYAKDGYIGGIAGATNYKSYDCTISNCVNFGTVSGKDASGKGKIKTGGIAGLNNGDSKISDCANGGDVSGGEYTGGIAGSNEGDVSNCGWLKTETVNKDLEKGVGTGNDGAEAVSIDQTGIDKSTVALRVKLVNRTVMTGGTTEITLSALPGSPDIFGGFVKKITVTPSDTEIISADVNNENGTITLTGTKEGTASIVVSADIDPTDFKNNFAPSGKDTPLSFTFNITVSDVPVTGITIAPEKMELKVGGSGKFTATVSPSDATDQGLTWSSDNEKIAAVDSEGSVKAIAAGTATITVTAADGKHQAKAAVTVTSTPRHGGGGNGCSAGTGALALLALAPLWLMRRKKVK